MFEAWENHSRKIDERFQKESAKQLIDQTSAHVLTNRFPAYSLIGGIYDVRHGVASTIVFPLGIDFNRPEVDERLTLVARALGLSTKDANDAAGAAINRVRELISEIGLPTRLREVGVPREGIQVIAEASMTDHQIRNNPCHS